MKKLYKILLLCGLLLLAAGTFVIINEDVSFVSADQGNSSYPGDFIEGCPPACDWGCYTDGTCCAEPSPGQPLCSGMANPD